MYRSLPTHCLRGGKAIVSFWMAKERHTEHLADLLPSPEPRAGQNLSASTGVA
jgi:hypothetical protein